MSPVFVAGRRIVLDPARSIGKGGEADVFDIGGGRALKLFKQPGHPDLLGLLEQQAQARARLLEHQSKLREFPAGLGAHVVTPDALCTDASGREVLGYTMRLLAGAEVLYRFGDRGFRQAVPGAAMVTILRGLRITLAELHASGVVVGDFNDRNVLVVGTEAHLVDADSFQFGRFACRVFSERFVDPLLCQPDATRPLLVRAHGVDSDWYAFAIMLMRSLLCVDPYGGVFKPKEQSQRVLAAARPLRRITVFHRDVLYPRPAFPPELLPDDLLHHLHLVFEKDRRGPFPSALIETLRFTSCETCGSEHARGVCPFCQPAAPAAIREAVYQRGRVSASRVMKTRGRVLAAAVQADSLRLLIFEDGDVKREDGSCVLRGDPPAQTRFGMQGMTALVGRGEQLCVVGPGAAPRTVAVDSKGTLPLFDANDRHLYWVRDGWLERDGALGPCRIGRVLAGQTQFFVGPSFGLGFYRAGELAVGFVFDADKGGINDSLALPALHGQLLDADCAFASDRVWLFTSATEGARTINRCTVFERHGASLGSAEACPGDGSWLGEIHGHCAAGAFLLAPTDLGIVRVDVVLGRLEKTRDFPDSEPFVDASSRLLASSRGVYVVDRQEVRLLTLAA